MKTGDIEFDLDDVIKCPGCNGDMTANEWNIQRFPENMPPHRFDRTCYRCEEEFSFDAIERNYRYGGYEEAVLFFKKLRGKS